MNEKITPYHIALLDMATRRDPTITAFTAGIVGITAVGMVG